MAEDLRDEIEQAVRRQQLWLPEERLIVVLVTYDGRGSCYSFAARLYHNGRALEQPANEWQVMELP